MASQVLGDFLLANPKQNYSYSPLLSLSSLPLNLRCLQILGPNEDECSSYSHTAVPAMEGHTGCVNSVHWSSDGSTLASAGDDTKVCIWKPQPSNDAALVPLSLRINASIETGHTRNIFNVKFVRNDLNKVITVAGDMQVRVFDINSSPATQTTSLSSPHHWNHYTHTTGNVQVLKCHRGRVKKIALDHKSNDVFFTCAEDGTVRRHDLREAPHSCRLASSAAYGSACPDPLIKTGFSLYSLSISPSRPDLMLVAGKNSYAYLYDRRMIRDCLLNEWGISTTNETQCVRRFGAEQALHKHIVSARYGRNGRDILVSYSSDNIYLFDSHGEASEEAPQSKRPSGEADLSSHSDSDNEEEVINSSSDDGSEMDQGDAGIEMEDVSEYPDSMSEDSEASNIHFDVPIVRPTCQYKGHSNHQTVKDVNFAFEDSCVVSGSDDGNFFLWNKASGDLVGIYNGDDGIVNVTESNPRLPIIAVSGLDPSFRIFGPDALKKSHANLVKDSASIMTRNAKRTTEIPWSWLVGSRALQMIADEEINDLEGCPTQ